MQNSASRAAEGAGYSIRVARIERQRGPCYGALAKPLAHGSEVAHSAHVITKDTPLVLGSGSPRRRDILNGLGIPLRVVAGDVEEAPLLAEAPADYLPRIVADKLADVTRRLVAEPPFAAVLVADTIVVLGDRIMGKPQSLDDACALLSALVGRTHRVDTRYAVACSDCLEHPVIERTIQTFVTMRPASDEEVLRYAETGEGRDKAGAYAAQGIGAFLIERIEGSYTNVV
jgi:septum formation protein